MLSKNQSAAALVFIAAIFSIEAKDIAKFESISGLVQYREKKGKWQNAKIATHLDANTELQTGPNGKATLLFPNGSKVTLSPGTLASLDSYGIGPYGTQTNMSLRMGRMNADIAKVNDANTRNHFRVRTPTVVAGVRGTIQDIGYTSDKGTDVTLVESSSEVVDKSGKTTVVPQGGSAQVTGTKTETADQREQKSNTVTMVAGEAATAGEAEMALSAGDNTFSSSFSDFDDVTDFYETIEEQEFLDFLNDFATVTFEQL